MPDSELSRRATLLELEAGLQREELSRTLQGLRGVSTFDLLRGGFGLIMRSARVRRTQWVGYAWLAAKTLLRLARHRGSAK